MIDNAAFHEAIEVVSPLRLHLVEQIFDIEVALKHHWEKQEVSEHVLLSGLLNKLNEVKLGS